MSSEASSQGGGRFNFDQAPWQREVLDAKVEPEVARIVLMWASQLTGKTETINNMIGSDIELDPCPMLMVQPTVDMGEGWSKERFTPMIRDTPCLRQRVSEMKSRSGDNTILAKRFPGGHLAIVGANAPGGLAMRPRRHVYFDEVDRYPASAGNEGDPIALAEKRTESFPDALIVETSTPTIKGVSRIEKSFNRSDRRYWMVTFPCCQHRTNLRWEMVKFENSDPETARLECPACRVRHDDNTRRQMVLGGAWESTAPFKRGVRGYHLNGIYCLFKPKKPFKTRLEQMVANHLDAVAVGKHAIQVWVNTFLAETWQEEADRIAAHEIAKRAEDYGPEVPDAAMMIVSGTDVQRDRLEIGIAAVGPVFEERAGKDGKKVKVCVGDEIWAMEYKVIPGDPRRPEVWKEHDDFLLRRTWKRKDGVELRLAMGCIDSGDGETTDDVYKYTKPRFAQKIVATKGSNVAAQPIVSGMLRSGRRKCPYYRLGTDTAKSAVYGRLRIDIPGAGYIHFTKRREAGFDENYFAGLTCEELQREHKKGREKLIWVKPQGARNEPLDIAVMWLAAISIVQPQWNVLTRNLAAKVKTYTLQPKNPEPGADAQSVPSEGEAKAETVEASPENAQKVAPAVRKPFVRPIGRGWGRGGSRSFVTGWKKF